MNQQTQQKQQTDKTEAESFKPNGRTIILVQSDARFEPRARKHIAAKWGKGVIDRETGLVTPYRIHTAYDANKLRENSVIVALYYDGDAPIRDPKTNEWRERDRGEKSGTKWTRKPEDPQVFETRPIECSAFMNTTGDDDGIRVPMVIRAINTEISRRHNGQPAIAHVADRGDDGKAIITIAEV